MVSLWKYSFIRSYCESGLVRDFLRSVWDTLDGEDPLPDKIFAVFFSATGESDSSSVSNSVSRSVDVVAVSPSVAVGVGGASLSGSEASWLESRDNEATFGKASTEEVGEVNADGCVEVCKGVR